MQTIRRYVDPVSAQCDQAMLESEGLYVFLKNENMGSMAPIFSPASGGIELQVEESEVDKALAILGPENSNPSKVKRLSKELNRLFLRSLGIGVAVGLIHAISHGFDTAKIGFSLSLILWGTIIAIIVLAVSKRIFRSRQTTPSK